MQLVFNAVSEAQPGPKWQALFQQYWPAYRAWFIQRGGEQGPSLTEAERALRQHMPELVPTFERLVELTGGDELAARLLSMYQPPAYLISCSQAALVTAQERVLVRNYDLDPKLNEGLILHSQWSGRPVIATSEFLWGVADGINADGLALSLAFGGRRVVGEGFGIPLILRYVLEVCADVKSAIAVLQRVPSHMAYNVTLLDRQGEAVTVQVAPDQAAVVLDTPVATNHQGTPEWAEHARFTATLEREQHLHDHLASEQLDGEGLINAFTRSPLYNTDYQRGFGTLYTAVYRPQQGHAEWHWPNAVWRQDLHDFKEDQRLIKYSAAGAKMTRPIVSPAASPAASPAVGRPVSSLPRRRKVREFPTRLNPTRLTPIPAAARTQRPQPAQQEPSYGYQYADYSRWTQSDGDYSHWGQSYGTLSGEDDNEIRQILAGLRQSSSGARQPWSGRLLDWCNEAEQRGEIPWHTLGHVFTASY